MSVRQEVEAIEGFDPLRVDHENFRLVLFYVPSLCQEYRAIAAQKRKKRDDLKVEIEKHLFKERMRLTEKRTDTARGKNVLTDAAVTHFTRYHPHVTALKEAISVLDRDIYVLEGAIEDLKTANAVALAYQGQTREEIKYGYAQHQLSASFTPVAQVRAHKPVSTSTHIDESFELPEI